MQVRQVAIACGVALAAALSGSAVAAGDNVISGGMAYAHPVEKGIDGINIDNQFGTKLASNGTQLGDAKLNPVVGSLLVGYAF
jgi:hypothetical protein